MPTTPTRGLPYPSADLPADVPLDLQKLAEKTEAEINKLDVRVSSDAQRLALFPSPIAGDRVYRTDKRYSQVYTGTSWVGAGGLVPIRPTALSSSTMSVAGDGAIVLTASPDLSRIEGLFSADFENYEVHFKIAGSVANETFGLRLSANQSTDQSTNYVFEGAMSRSNGPAFQRWASTGLSYWDVSRLDSDTVRRRTMGRVTLMAPFSSTEATGIVFNASGLDNGALSTTAAGFHNVSKSFDGFAICSSTSTVTGTIRVFGVGRG